MQRLIATVPLILFCAAAQPALKAAQRSETRVFAVTAGDTVIVQNDYGRVRVSAGEGDHAEVTALKTALDDQRLSQVETVLQKSGNKLFVQSYFYDYQDETVEFTVRTPPGVNLVVWGANPGVELVGLSGYVHVQTLTGGVAANGLTGPVSILTEAGAIDYQAQEQPLREVHLESVSGQIRSRLSETLNLRVWMRAGGKLNWNDEVQMSAGQMERQLGEGGPLLYAGSMQGDVRFSLGGPQAIPTPVIAQRRTPVGTLPSDSGVITSSDTGPDQPASYPSSRERAEDEQRHRDAPPELHNPVPEQRSPQDEEYPRPGTDSGAAPDTSAETNQSGKVFRANVNWIYLNTSVRDQRTNRAVAGLGIDDFAVYEDGQLQQVERFQPSEAPISLLLLLDVSGSTRDFIDLIQDASIEFTRQIKSNDRIAVATFNSRVRLIQDFTNDRTEVARSIRRIRSGGGTAFYDALDTSIRHFMRGVEGRKAIVVFTDGVDNQLTGDFSDGSTTTFDELFRSVQEIDTTIYNIFLDTRSSVGVGQSRAADILIDILRGGGGRRRGPRPPIRRSGSAYDIARDQLEAIADQTGGRLYAPTRIEDLRNTYSEIADDLRIQYSLAYVSSNPNLDGSWREIEVRIQGHPGAVARTRRGYYADASSFSTATNRLVN